MTTAQTNWDLNFKLEAIFSAMAPVIALTIEYSERCQEIEASLLQECALSDRSELNTEQSRELTERINGYLHSIDPERNVLFDCVSKLSPLVQQFHQLRHEWRQLEAQSSTFKQEGKLSAADLAQGASEIEPLLTSINATLDEMQAKLAQVQDSADSEIKSAVRDYLPRHQELKALINDPQHSAEVSHFLCMLDSF